MIVNVSEALATIPFFTLTPQGGNPMSVELSRSDDGSENLTYTGFFEIKDTTPSGTAYAVFSAMDIAGNRGTDVDTGTSILLDTDGPAISRMVVAPLNPIQNDPLEPVQVTIIFGLNEAVKPETQPALSYLLSGAGRDPFAITQIDRLTTQGTDVQTWQALFTLEADAGQTDPETLTLMFSAMDDLENPGTKIDSANHIQVYQGDLPPLPVPTGLTGKPLAGGQVYLTWDPVENATGYRLFRQTPNESELAFLAEFSDEVIHTDTTVMDGDHLYAVASMRLDNGQEAVSGPSTPITVNTDATLPPAPTNLSLELTSKGIRCTWQAPALIETITYNLYRADTNQILSVEGMTPLAAKLSVTDLIDPTPSPTEHCDVVTAVDAVGNESLPSNFFYLNFDLLPITNLSVVQEDNNKPVVSWTHPASDLLRYEISVKSQGKEIFATSLLPDSPSFIDQGYTDEERTYTIVAVDQNSAQSMGRAITLPKVAFVLESFSIKRGIMNQVNILVDNLFDQPLTALTASLTLNSKEHTSTPITRRVMPH